MASTSLESLLQKLYECIECSIHAILHARNIYPAATFELKNYAGASVAQSRHPRLRTYISQFLSAAQTHSRAGALTAIVLCVFNARHERVVERYVWRIVESDALRVTRSENGELPADELVRYIHTPLSRHDVTEDVRGMVLSLKSYLAHLPALPEEGLNWDLSIQTLADCRVGNAVERVGGNTGVYVGPPPGKIPQSEAVWIPSNSGLFADINESNEVTPINAQDWGPFKWQCYAELISDKQRLNIP